MAIGNNFLLSSFIYFFNSVANVLQGILIKYYQGSLNVGIYQIITIKSFISMLLILPFAIKYIKFWKKNLKIVILLSLLYCGDLLCCNTGFKTVPINTGTLILLLVPLWIIVFGRFILKEKSFNKVNAIAIIICLIGVLIPIRNEISFSGFNIGYIFLFLASLIIPLGLILQKKFSDCRPVPYALFTNAFALFIISFFLSSICIGRNNSSNDLLFDFSWFHSIDLDILKAGLFIAICDLVEFAGVYVAYQLAEAALLQPIRFTRILISMLMSFLILREYPTCEQTIGAFMILSANLFSIWYSRKYQNIKEIN